MNLRLKQIVTAALGLALVISSAQARSLADIRASKTLIIGVNGNIPPFQFKAGNVLTGYEVEIMKMVAANMGLTPVFVEYPAMADMTKALSADKVDVTVATLAQTSTREKTFDMTHPYACLGATVMTTDPKIRTSLDLKGKRIGVVKDTVFESYARKLPFDKTVLAYPTREEHAAAYLNGKYDVAVGWKAMVPFLAKVFNVPFQDTPVLWSIPVSMMVQGGNSLTKLSLDSSIDKLRRDPRYNELNTKYFPGETITCNQ